MIDVMHEIIAAERKVGSRVLDTGEARTVTISRTYPGSIGVGWDLALMGLGLHLTSGKSVDPHEVAAWTASQEGKQFMSLTSQQWCDASIEAGADAAAAQAAADRTTAAYTATEPQPP